MTKQRNSICTNPMTREQAVSAILALCCAKGREPTVQVLVLFKAKCLTDIPPARYGKLVDACTLAMTI